MIRKIYGAIRLVLAISIVILAVLCVAVASLVPIKIRGLPLTAWAIQAVIRLLCFVFRIRVKCEDPELILEFGGLIFPNHTSVLDILVLYHCAPMRYLAAHDVADRPLIGWLAKQAGTVFVNRKSPRSRLEARNQVVDALRQNDRPPVVLFPEGRLGPGDTLFPFRHGAFGIAIESGASYVPCAIRYDPLDVVLWRAAAAGEGMWTSIWRMVQHADRVDADVIPLKVVHPRAEDSPKDLAAEARQDIAHTLGLSLD